MLEMALITCRWKCSGQDVEEQEACFKVLVALVGAASSYNFLLKEADLGLFFVVDRKPRFVGTRKIKEMREGH